MEKREEYNEIITTAVNRAGSSLNHFFELLKLDPELFKHLWDIEVHVGETGEGLNAKYHSKEEHFITLNENYLESLFAGLDDGTYTKQYVINDIATSIIHETIHANRSVYVKDGNITYDVISLDEDDIIVDEAYLNSLMSSVMVDEEYFNSYVVVPLKVDLLDDDTYNVYAYNTVTNQYNIYEHQEFKTSNIHEIADEINTNRLRYTVTKTIPCTVKFENISYDDIEEVIDVQEVSTGDFLEDCLVEMIARFILYSRKAKKFNLDAYVESLKDEELLPEYRLALEMLHKMGMGIIMWFVLSYYDDFFDKKLYAIYKVRYDEVMEEFRNRASEDENISFDEMVVSVTNILENLN